MFSYKLNAIQISWNHVFRYFSCYNYASRHRCRDKLAFCNQRHDWMYCSWCWINKMAQIISILSKIQFHKVVWFLLTQQLIKLNSFLRECGDSNRYSNNYLLNDVCALINWHVSSNLMFAFNAALTRRHRWYGNCCDCFIKLMKFLLTQKLWKLRNFSRESGDFAVFAGMTPQPHIPLVQRS